MRDLKVKQIGELELFRGCRREDIMWIAAVADTIDVPAGRTIVGEGETARQFAVLMQGTAISADGDGDVALAPGAYFGAVELVDGGYYRRTVWTTGPARLLVFETRAFRSLLDRVPTVGRRLLREIVSDIRPKPQRSRSLRAVS